MGREVIVELLDIDETVQEIIYEGSITQLHQYLKNISFSSFRVAAIEKVTSGLTTVEEIMRVLPRSSLNRKISDQNLQSRIESSVAVN